MKYSYSPDMLPTIRRISNSCKVVEYSHVVKCEYKLRHIPNSVVGSQLMFLNAAGHTVPNLHSLTSYKNRYR